MIMSRGRRHGVVAVAACALSLACAVAGAQDYPPMITRHPVDVHFSEIGHFPLAIDVTSSANVLKQWRVDDERINRNTVLCYADAAHDGDEYECVVSNAFGRVVSRSATAHTYAWDGPVPPTIGVQPSDASALVGDTATFSVLVYYVTGVGTRSYQWQKDGVNISGATDTEYTTPALALGDDGSVYRCRVSCTSGASPVYTDGATLEVLAAPAAPRIWTQPANQSVVAGECAVFEISASGVGTVEAQWYRNGVEIVGATSLEMLTTQPATLADDGATYTCTVSSGHGQTTTVAATLTVSAATPPAITTDLPDTNVVTCDIATFRVTASGSKPRHYVWFVDGVEVEDWDSCRFDLFADTPAYDGTQIKCVVSNAAGSVETRVATLSVAPPAAPALSEVPGGGQPGGPAYAFYMGTHEVTVQEFCRFLNDAEYHPDHPRGRNMFFGQTAAYAGDTSDYKILTYTQSRVIRDCQSQAIGCRHRPREGYADHPVTGVTWYGAVKYCNWLSIYAGRGDDSFAYVEGPDPTVWRPATLAEADWEDGFQDAERAAWIADPDAVNGFRLPMIHAPEGAGSATLTATAYNEFYKAAAWDGSTHTVYAFGRDTIGGADANYAESGDPFEPAETGFGSEHGGPTTPVCFYDGITWSRADAGWIGGVASFATNPNENTYGIHDLAGNVWEWTNHRYTSTEYVYGRIYGGGHCRAETYQAADYGGVNWLMHDSDYNNGMRVLAMTEPTSYIAVDRPASGFWWVPGTTEQIRWVCSADVANVKIEVSRDGDAGPWDVIAASTPAAPMAYDWTVAEPASSHAVVRVSDASNATLTDDSREFTIAYPMVTVLSPNGGEMLELGTSHKLLWDTRAMEYLKIELSRDGGATWETLHANMSIHTQYWWGVRGAASTNCLIRMSDATDATFDDVSDAPFAMVGVSVSTPNGGEIYAPGETVPVTWTSADVTQVRVELSGDDGATWEYIDGGTPLAAASSLDWTATGSESATCLVRLTDADDASRTDVSDETFAITSGTTYTLTLIAGSNGSVAADPLGPTYVPGAVVDLTATPDSGYVVESWSGTDDDTSTAATNQVTMNADATVTVAFVLGAPPVDTDGDGMSDADEIAVGYDELESDQDGNGVPDGLDDWDNDTIDNQTELSLSMYPGAPPSPAPPADAGGGGISCVPGGAMAAAWLALGLLACVAALARRRER